MSDKKNMHVSTDPIECAAMTLAVVNRLKYGEENIQSTKSEIQKEFTKQLKSLESSDLSKIESMLYSQAIILQDIFNRHVKFLSLSDEVCGLNEKLNFIQVFAQIAFKAQNQCRNTLATLAEIKRPNRTIFVRQQNNVLNQQINASSKNGQIEKNHRNELLSENKHEALDLTGTTKTSRVNSSMETMETINRSKND